MINKECNFKMQHQQNPPQTHAEVDDMPNYKLDGNQDKNINVSNHIIETTSYSPNIKLNIQESLFYYFIIRHNGQPFCFYVLHQLF